MSYKNDPVVDRRESDDRRITWFARASIAFAVLLAVGEAVRNWGDWQWWPFWLVDYITAGLLFFGGRCALKESTERRVSPLVGAFGFSASLGYISFFGHMSDINGGTNGPIPHIALTAIIGVLFVFALGAFFWLLAIAMRVERG